MDENQTSDFSLPEEFENRGILSRINEWIKNHSRAITSFFIVAVIIGVGIYAYKKPRVEDKSLVAVGDEQEEKAAEENKETDKENNPAVEVLETTAGITETSKNIVEVKQSTPRTMEIKEDKIVISALKSEGITHLARYAFKEYVKDRSDISLNVEQKIYIEDYLRKKTDNAQLEVGDTRTFSKDLMNEAIDAAKQLNEKQIQNLSKYVRLVPELI